MTVRPDEPARGGPRRARAALADSSFALACNSRGTPTVAAGFDVTFLEPAHDGDVLVATAEERSLRGRSGIYASRSPATTRWSRSSGAAAARCGSGRIEGMASGPLVWSSSSGADQRFGSLTAVDDRRHRWRRAHGSLGPNGAEDPTLRMLLGLSGRLRHRDHRLVGRTPTWTTARGRRRCAEATDVHPDGPAATTAHHRRGRRHRRQPRSTSCSR